MDELISGRKTIEMRSLETLTLTDGKRTRKFNIVDIENIRTKVWSRALPQFIKPDCPAVLFYLEPMGVKNND